jgi:hypothetical protein
VILAGLAIALAIGLASARLVVGGRWWPPGTLALSLATGVGLGISSCLYIGSLALLGPSTWALAAVETAALLTLLWLNHRFPARATGTDLPALPWFCKFLLIVVTLCAGSAFVLFVTGAPHGEWDAWSIWNLRARFLYRGGADWRQAFSPLLSHAHPDYPLLVPASIARLWRYAGIDSTVAPALVCGLFAAATGGVLFSAIRLLRDGVQAALAVTVLFGAGLLVRTAAAESADGVVGFFLLAAVSLLALADRFPEQASRLTIAAGCCAAFTGWTKNEGLLLLGAIVAGRGAALIREGGALRCFRQCVWLAAGAVPVLAVILWSKLTLAPPSYLLSGMSAAKLTDLSRYAMIATHFARQIFSFGSFVVSPLVILAVYLFCVRIETNRIDRAAVFGNAVTLVLSAIGFFAVYVVTPYDLEWHLNTALARLLLQLWPAFLFTFFMVARIPQIKSKVMEKPEKHPRTARAAT